MSDDPLSRFTGKKAPSASAKPPSASAQPPSSALHSDHEDYEAFNNKVRPVCIEIRCHRTGLSYSIPYAHLGAIVFNFRTGKELLFTGCGLAVKVEGWSLGEIARALRLHTCAVIEDHSTDHAAAPRPADPNAAFIEKITVEVPRATPAPQGK
jgi:hypothetical protein